VPTAFKNFSQSLNPMTWDIYTVPSATTAIVIGAHVTNADTSAQTFTMYYTDASRSNTQVPLANAVSIPTNSAFEPISKLVLQAGDVIWVTSSSTSTAVHMALSVLEIT